MLKESRLTIRGDGDQDPVASEEVSLLVLHSDSLYNNRKTDTIPNIF